MIFRYRWLRMQVMSFLREHAVIRPGRFVLTVHALMTRYHSQVAHRFEILRDEMSIANLA